MSFQYSKEATLFEIHNIELCQNGLKGKSVKHGGGITSELLCSKSWRLNMGNVEHIYI